LYELKIDTNGDAVADIAYRVRFSSSADRTQTATVRRIVGAQAAETGDSGQIVIEAAPVSTGREARVKEAGRYRFFAGWRSDPFFFDTLGALNDLQFTGDDFFIDKDVCSIVLEMPNTALAAKRISLWARTLDGKDGVWIQADRGALAAQAVFLVGSERDAYHAGEPANDARFISVSRMRWSTPVAMRRTRQGGWREHCCPTCCPTIQRVPHFFQATAVHLPMIPRTPS
jgi:hypothetical protein